MPSSRILIASNTLSTSAASVTFSSIPSIYTDLVLKLSVRNSNASTTATLKLLINNDTTTLYSFTRMRGTGSSTSSQSNSGEDYLYGGIMNGNTSTSNTFSSSEIYIPSYTASQNRPISTFTTQEDNSATAYIDSMANLYRSTTAINRLDISCVSGNFVSGSSFWLYGLKNS